VEVQRQLHDLEATLEMNPGQELSEDEARLVEQLENLKMEFGEMLYELRHKLNMHVTSDVIDDVSRDQFSKSHLTTRAVSNCCCSKGSAPYWSNPLFLIFDIRAFWRSGLNGATIRSYDRVAR